MATPRKTKTSKRTAAGGGTSSKPEAKPARSKRRPKEATESAKLKGSTKKKGKPRVKVGGLAGGTTLAAPKATAAGRGRVPLPVGEKEAKKVESPKAAQRKAVVDPDFLKQMREALVHQRERLVSVVRSTQAQMAEKTKDLPDVSDQASEGYGDELAVGLMAIEAAQLEDIQEAINRIDDGSYGLCVECEKPIPRKRLEVLPFVRRCLACEGAHEHRKRVQPGYAEEEESQ